MIWSSLYVILCGFILLLGLFCSNASQQRTQRSIDTSQWIVQRHPMPELEDYEIIVVNNFFNESQLALFESMFDAVNRSEWHYTTNTGENGAKVRSNEDKKRRRTKVESYNKKSQFSYSKHELLPSHSIVESMKSHFRQKELMKELSNLFNVNRNSHDNEIIKAKYITELFVAKYLYHDFLSWHGDGASGSFAFVVGLTKDWNSVTDGGSLQFLCKGRFASDVCVDLKPSYNSLTMFRTRYYAKKLFDGQFPLVHRVDRVRARNKERLTITGWYICEDDKLSPEELKMCADMKGSSCEEDDEVTNDSEL